MNTPQLAAPEVLLAEDDAISALYLGDALALLGARVTHHADGEAALAAARGQRFALLLLDERLPGRTGTAVLAALRADAGAASHASPAIATCAGLAPAQVAGFLAAGFDDALPKPVSLARLRATWRVHRQAGWLDDDAGVAACGSAETLVALRGLLLAELAECAAIFEAPGGATPHALRERLHRLRAGAGFCGASRLQQAAADLHDALAVGPLAEDGMAEFRAVLAATRARLIRPGARAPATTRPAAGRRGAR